MMALIGVTSRRPGGGAARRAGEDGPRRRACARALLDPGLDLTLRPMRYPSSTSATGRHPQYLDRRRGRPFRRPGRPRRRLLPAEQRLVQRLVAFFATGDSIVANNLVLNLYKHINAPEARLFLSRQLFEEAVHVQFYLTLLDTYVTDETSGPRPSPRSSTSPPSGPRRSSASSGSTRWRTSTASRRRTTAGRSS